MTELFLKVLNMSISASYLVLAVLFLRLILKKSPKWIAVLLWGIVAVRLLCPFSVESAMSLVPSAETVPKEILSESGFRIQTGIAPVDLSVNDYLGERYFEGVTVPQDAGHNIVTILSFIWLFGIVLLIAYTIISYVRLYRKIDTAVVYRAGVYQCDGIDSPFVLGIIKPRIYIPFHLQEQEFNYVLAHENAHISRRDYLWKPLGFFSLVLHWFNPLIWVSYVLLCRDIEQACDEKVVRNFGTEERADYSKTLLTFSVKQNALSACPLSFGEVGVRERVRGVLNYKKPAFWVVGISLLVCVVVAICFLTNPEKHEAEKETSETTLASFGSADINHDGIDETFRINEIEKETIYQLNVLSADGSVIWSEDAAIPHTGWNSVFLCSLDGQDYLLRYHPSMYQGMANYGYELYWIENGVEQVVMEDNIEFSTNPGELPSPSLRAKMDTFAEHINSLLNSSVVLLSTKDGLLLYGGVAADNFREEYLELEVMESKRSSLGRSDNSESNTMTLQEVMDRILTEYDESDALPYGDPLDNTEDALVLLCQSESKKYSAYGFSSQEYGQQGILIDNVIDGSSNWNYFDNAWSYGSEIPTLAEQGEYDVIFTYTDGDGVKETIYYETFDTGTMEERKVAQETISIQAHIKDVMVDTADRICISSDTDSYPGAFEVIVPKNVYDRKRLYGGQNIYITIRFTGEMSGYLPVYESLYLAPMEDG